MDVSDADETYAMKVMILSVETEMSEVKAEISGIKTIENERGLTEQ